MWLEIGFDELEIVIFGSCKDENVKRLSTDSWKFFEIIFESISNLIFIFDKTWNGTID